MLQTIRERAQGWIAWAIVILITIPFALWGIQSYFGGTVKTVVASVDGVEISQREFERQYRNARRMLKDRLGAAYDPESFADEELRQQVLESLIRETLLLKKSQAMGLRASDEEIRLAIMANPAFQANGQFDKQAYERALAIQGLSPAQFEQQLRRRLVGSQLQRGVGVTEFVTDRELAMALRLLHQRREISFVRVESSELVDDGPVSEEALQAYYESHPEAFESPERVKLEYLVLNEETIGERAVPDDEELRRRYEADKGRFGEPERRQVRHILVSVASSTEDGEAQARDAIAAARERILAGEGFAEVAEEFSEDPESAERGGLLGEIEAGMMDQAFETAAFNLSEGEVSEPIRTPFGYHIIRVDEILPASIQPFGEVREMLAEEAAKERYESIYYDWAERLATEAYEAVDTLRPAAEALGLEIRASDWLTRSGGEGILASPRVMSAAFSEEVVREGLNSELIEPERGELEAIVLRVVDHREAALKPLAEVRDEIRVALRAEQAQRAAWELAQTFVERLREGGDLDEVAGDWSVVRSGMVGRDATELPAPVRSLAFRLAHPGPGGASYGSTPLGNGDAAVVAVTAVQDGSEATEEDEIAVQGRERDALRQSVAAQYYSAMLDDMAKRAKVERDLELIAGADR